MEDYIYLILGGGMAAAAAVRGIREIDHAGTIGLLSDEVHPPYKRPPLSKKLWAGKPESSIWLPLKEAGVTLHLGRRAVHLNPEQRLVIDDQGTSYRYEKLLMAVGGTPRRLPWDQGEDIVYFRTFSDYQRVRAVAREGRRFAIIGGGFIGSEMAAALCAHGNEVLMVFPDDGLCDRIVGRELGRYLNDYYRQQGVEILSGDTPISMERDGARFILRTEQERNLTVDGVIAGIGLLPNTQLAEAAGLAVDDGILVGARLHTSNPHIYAAGDVANVMSPALGVRRRVEHEDNATAMGRQAGRNMAGAGEEYCYLPFFYSDLFDLGYEAVGEVDARHRMVIDWQEPYREGVIYYLAGGQVRGVLMWNVWDRLDAARALITEPRPWREEELRGRLLERGVAP